MSHNRNTAGRNQHKPCPPDEDIKPYLELYYSMGRSDVEIQDLLKAHYDTAQYGFSVKSIKRRREKWSLLSTRQQKHGPDSIAAAIQEIRKRFPSRGSATIKQTLMLEYNMHVSRETIRLYLLQTEPEKVAQRKGKKFKRKRYIATGVNESWPQDQHDKWGPKFGLWLHCSLDAYSGYINWLKIWWTNKNPRLITKYYLDCCREMKAVPLTTQADPGSENNGVANAHTIIRQTLDPSLKGTQQHRVMTEHNNVKSEGNWSIYRRDFAPGFEDIFDNGVNQGVYDRNDPLECLVFRWLAIPWMQSELDSWVIQRNCSAPRRDKNKILPQGIPAIIRSQPSRYGSKDFKIGVPTSLFDEMEAKYAPPSHAVFDLVPPAFNFKANAYYNAMGQPDVGSNTFWHVYQELLAHFRAESTNTDTAQSYCTDTEYAIPEEDKIELLPGMKPLRMTVVGNGDGFNLDGSLCVELTESEEEENEERGSGRTGMVSPFASMMPSIGSTSGQ